MKDLINEDFEKYKKLFDQKNEEVRKALDEMNQAYEGCDRFSKDVAENNHWQLNDEQKAEEKLLLENYKKSIDRWEDAKTELSRFLKEKF